MELRKLNLLMGTGSRRRRFDNITDHAHFGDATF
jgi:hypothetical protein